MNCRAAQRFGLIALSLTALAWLLPGAAPAGMRHAGTVLMVDVSAGSLVLDEYWVGGQRRALKVRITPDTQVVLSERNELFKDLTGTFTTTPMRARDLKAGDFVVVQLLDTAPDSVASLVMVTLPAAGGS